MRRVALFCAAALAVPASSAARPDGTGEGTLSVKNGEGKVTLDVRGAVVGRLGSGVLEIEDPKGGDCDALNVWGAERERREFRPKDFEAIVVVCRFTGSNIRFRLVGGQQAVRIKGAKDIDLSVVGRGAFVIRGTGGKDGTFSLNGEPYTSLPEEPLKSELGVTTPRAGGNG